MAGLSKCDELPDPIGQGEALRNIGSQLDPHAIAGDKLGLVQNFVQAIQLLRLV